MNLLVSIYFMILGFVIFMGTLIILYPIKLTVLIFDVFYLIWLIMTLYYLNKAIMGD